MVEICCHVEIKITGTDDWLYYAQVYLRRNYKLFSVMGCQFEGYDGYPEQQFGILKSRELSTVANRALTFDGITDFWCIHLSDIPHLLSWIDTNLVTEPWTYIYPRSVLNWQMPFGVLIFGKPITDYLYSNVEEETGVVDVRLVYWFRE